MVKKRVKKSLLKNSIFNAQVAKANIKQRERAIGLSLTAEKGFRQDTGRKLMLQKNLAKEMNRGRKTPEQKKNLANKAIVNMNRLETFARQNTQDHRDMLKVEKQDLKNKSDIVKQVRGDFRKKRLEDAQRRTGEISKNVNKRFSTLANKKVINRKIVRKGPRPVLDLRRRPEREVPVEQHGFKEEQIGYGKLL